MQSERFRSSDIRELKAAHAARASNLLHRGAMTTHQTIFRHQHTHPTAAIALPGRVSDGGSEEGEGCVCGVVGVGGGTVTVPR
jgi:hypothetical protein